METSGFCQTLGKMVTGDILLYGGGAGRYLRKCLCTLGKTAWLEGPVPEAEEAWEDRGAGE